MATVDTGPRTDLPFMTVGALRVPAASNGDSLLTPRTGTRRKKVHTLRRTVLTRGRMKVARPRRSIDTRRYRRDTPKKGR